MKTSVVRRLCFSAGHRLVGHEGGCRHIHGHNYVVFVHATAEQLDAVGRVIDFSVLKERIGGWIDRNWDHAFLLNTVDQELLALLINQNEKYWAFHQKNPTAEVMAQTLLDVCPSLLAGTGVVATCIEVHETENCFAVVGPREGA